MYLEELIGELKLEDSKIECKGILNRDEIVGWLKTIAGFANAAGGDFYIGVENKTNKLIGFDRIGADNERNYFNNQVNEHLTPRPPMTVSFLPYSVRENERFVIKVSVSESPVKPVILKINNVPSIYMRRNGFTNGATYEEIIEMSVQSKQTQYDVLRSDVRFESGNFTKLREFYKNRSNGKELTEKSLRSMGFMDENGYLSNGAVLFSDNYNGGKTEVLCSLFSGFNRGSERIITVNKFSGCITDVIDYVMEFVNQRMNHSILKLNDKRINIDAYPPRALFEGVINAIAHRDYYLDGTQIQVEMFRDRIEISSPGGFYRGVPLGKTYNLSGIISKRRNELISNVLVACNVMEAAGTGFDKISEDYINADEKHKPFIFSSSDHFTLVLPDMTYENGVSGETVPEIIFVPAPNSTVYDEKVLAFCFYKAHKVSEIAAFLGISDSSYLRKQILGNLSDSGYLIMSKAGRATYYKSNPNNVKLN